MNLTQDERTVLERHCQLAAELAATKDVEECRRLAADKNVWLTEGVEDRGRLTLTMIAGTVRYLSNGGIPTKWEPERVAFLKELADLPEVRQLVAHTDLFKGRLLSS